MLDRYTEWQYEWEPTHLENTRDFIFRNTFADIERVLRDVGESFGTRFEFECYDVGHLYNLAHFLDRGLVKPPLFVQTIFGILGGIGADPEHLLHMRHTADHLFGDDHQSGPSSAAGRHQMGYVTDGRDYRAATSGSGWRTASTCGMGSSPRAMPPRCRRSARSSRTCRSTSHRRQKRGRCSGSRAPRLSRSDAS